jgi:dynein heavy chain
LNCSHSNIVFIILGIQQIALSVKSQIEDFKPSIPLIQALRAPGMRNRHWEEVCSIQFLRIKKKIEIIFFNF